MFMQRQVMLAAHETGGGGGHSLHAKSSAHASKCTRTGNEFVTCVAFLAKKYELSFYTRTCTQVCACPGMNTCEGTCRGLGGACDRVEQWMVEGVGTEDAA